MAQRHIVFRPATKPGDLARQLTARFEAVRREFEVPDRFPPEVLAEAAAAAGAATLPERDETAVPFITIDPPTSMDLDQAMSIERSGEATGCAAPSTQSRAAAARRSTAPTSGSSCTPRS